MLRCSYHAALFQAPPAQAAGLITAWFGVRCGLATGGGLALPACVVLLGWTWMDHLTNALAATIHQSCWLVQLAGKGQAW